MPLNEILDLHKAFRRIEQDKRDDAWPDVVGYRDVKRNLGEILETIKLKVKFSTNLKGVLHMIYKAL